MRLARLLRIIKPDVLYMDAEPENYAALQALLLRKTVVPAAVLSLVSSRTIDHHKVGFPYRLSFTHRWCDQVIRRSPVDTLFCRAKGAMKFVGEYAHHVVYLPHSVDCSVFTPRAMSNREAEGTFTVGFVGRIVESKGIQTLLDAFLILPDSARLQLVGNGSYVGRVEEFMDRHGLSDRVSIRPAVPYEEMPAVMSSLDVVVLPSLETRFWNEQVGRVLIEAMACGVPVVASASGGIPDVVGEAGLLFKTGDEKTLAAQLQRLLEDARLRQHYAEAGRARALAEYDAPILARKLHEEIVRAVEERRRKHVRNEEPRFGFR
jgi:glycosyltransferase involved in cell wall biosynthesis